MVEPFGTNQGYGYEGYGGKGTDSKTSFHFNRSRARGWSDLEVIFHEMRHQLDFDKGEAPIKEVDQEKNAVSSQNYVRILEGKKPLDNYSNQYFYSKEDLNKSHGKLLELIKNALKKKENSFYIFY